MLGAAVCGKKIPQAAFCGNIESLPQNDGPLWYVYKFHAPPALVPSL